MCLIAVDILSSEVDRMLNAVPYSGMRQVCTLSSYSSLCLYHLCLLACRQKLNFIRIFQTFTLRLYTNHFLITGKQAKGVQYFLG